MRRYIKHQSQFSVSNLLPTWSRFVRWGRLMCSRLFSGRAGRWTWAELWRTWWSAGRLKCQRSERRPELGLSSPTAAVPGTNICSISWFYNLFLGYLYLKTQYFQQVIYKIYNSMTINIKVSAKRMNENWPCELNSIFFFNLRVVNWQPVEVLYPPVDRHDGQDAEDEDRTLKGFLINEWTASKTSQTWMQLTAIAERQMRETRTSLCTQEGSFWSVKFHRE